MRALAKHDGANVRSFPSEQWTLEFDLARQRSLAVIVHQAVQISKRRAGQTRDQIAEHAKAEVDAWQANPQMSVDDVAVRIYEPLYRRHVSKTEVAQQLCALIACLEIESNEFRARVPPYLAGAIDHVTGGQPGEGQ